MSEIESRIKKLEAKLQPGWVFALFDDAVVLLSNGEVMSTSPSLRLNTLPRVIW